MDNHEYFYGLFLPSLLFTVIYIFGFPFALSLILFKNRRSLEDEKFSIRFGFLYDNFKANLWWMEIAFIFRRILIAAASSLFERTEVEETIVICILFVFFAFFLFLPPYSDKSEVNCEIFSTTTILVLIGLGIYYQNLSFSWLFAIGLVFYCIGFLSIFFFLIKDAVPKVFSKKICQKIRFNKN